MFVWQFEALLVEVRCKGRFSGKTTKFTRSIHIFYSPTGWKSSHKSNADFILFDIFFSSLVKTCSDPIVALHSASTNFTTLLKCLFKANSLGEPWNIDLRWRVCRWTLSSSTIRVPLLFKFSILMCAVWTGWFPNACSSSSNSAWCWQQCFRSTNLLETSPWQYGHFR